MNREFTKRDEGEWLEVRGFVRRLLSDDNDGSRHQRFIIDIGDRRTLLIAHNIDLASRIPLGMGDRVQVRGMYEWNDLGGLLHWDPPRSAWCRGRWLGEVPQEKVFLGGGLPATEIGDS